MFIHTYVQNRKTLSRKLFFLKKPYPANTFSQKTLSRTHFFIKKPYPANTFSSKTLSSKHFFIGKPYPANTFSSKNHIPQTLFHQKTLSRKHLSRRRPHTAGGLRSPAARDRRRPKVIINSFSENFIEIKNEKKLGARRRAFFHF